MRMYVGALVILVLLPAVPEPVQSQESGAVQFKFTLGDGVHVSGRFATPTLTLETELGKMAVPSSRINDCQVQSEIWTIGVGYNRLVGRLLDTSLKVQVSTGSMEISVARIQAITRDYMAGTDSAPWPPAPDVKPVRSFAVERYISEMLLSADRKSLWFLEAAADNPVLRRFDTERQSLDESARKLPRGQSGLRISADGTTLISFSAVQPGAAGQARSGRILVLDTRDLTPKSDFTIEFSIADLQPHPKGYLLVSGWGPKSEPLAVVDPAAASIISLWNVPLQASTFRISADGKRAFATSLTADSHASISIPDDPRKAVPSIWNLNRPRGDRGMIISPDDRFAIWQSGAVLRLGADAESFPVVAQTVRHRSAAVAPESGTLLLATPDGRVHRFTPPEFRPMGSLSVGFPWYATVVDPDRKLIYAATDRRDKPLLGGGEPKGDFAVFELDAFVRSQARDLRPVVNRAPDGELKPMREHPLAVSVRGMEVIGTPSRFVVLDGTDSVIRTFAAATGEVAAISARFPYPVRVMSVDRSRQAIHVFGPGPPERPGTGRWYEVDSETLAVRSATPLEFVPHDSAIDALGRLYVTSDGGARSELWILDPVRHVAIGRWGLESDRVHVRISPASKVLYLTPPFRACAIPGDEALAKPVLVKPTGPYVGLIGEPFQLGPGGTPLLFESGVLFSAVPASIGDLSPAGVLPAHRSATFLGRLNRIAISEGDGLLRVSVLPELRDHKVYRTNLVLYSMAYDPASATLCGASEGIPRTRMPGLGSGIGGIVFFKVAE